MFELSLINFQTQKNVKSEDDNDYEETFTVGLFVFVLLYFIILLWALVRVFICSSATPDSRAIHLLFCLASPTLYLVSSYLVPGFCP